MNEQQLRQIIREEVAALLRSKPRNFSLNEACSMIGISRATFNRKRSAGEIRTVKFGAKVLVPEEEINRLSNGR